ncbi:MAG: hypothetical protein IJ900_02410 [Paludibacteraceae bacterium]|nr:hypothetical protein [Paludibacteraceae bacterium]
MSKVTLNSPLKTLSGKLNRQSDLVFVTRHRTESVSTRTLTSSFSSPDPSSTHPASTSPASCMDARSSSPSPAQQRAQKDFAQLRRQAQYILATPSLRDSYLRQWTKQRRFHTLLGFIMHSLSASCIDAR